MKILFGINQFSGLVGGSLLPLEVAEYLKSLGHECLVGANYVADPLQTIASRLQIPLTADLTTINAFDFDLVWLQNQTAPLLQYEITPSSQARTLFVFAHLSTQTYLEYPGLFHEPLLADAILANSPETKQHLADLGVATELVTVFPNPAPAAFWLGRNAAARKQLKVAMLVSNHPPPEMLGALQILEARGARVRHIGRDALYRRVTPTILSQADMVIAIGKTVQYALARGIPAYVYDRYGGPGYLSEQNFSNTAWANFSGRCCNRKLTAEAIAEEIVNEFPHASKFTAELKKPSLDAYRLEPYVDHLLSAVPNALKNSQRLVKLEDNSAMIKRERALARAIRENYNGHLASNSTARRLRRFIKAMRAGKKAPSSSPPKPV